MTKLENTNGVISALDEAPSSLDGACLAASTAGASVVDSPQFTPSARIIIPSFGEKPALRVVTVDSSSGTMKEDVALSERFAEKVPPHLLSSQLNGLDGLSEIIRALQHADFSSPHEKTAEVKLRIVADPTSDYVVNYSLFEKLERNKDLFAALREARRSHTINGEREFYSDKLSEILERDYEFVRNEALRLIAQFPGAAALDRATQFMNETLALRLMPIHPVPVVNCDGFLTIPTLRFTPWQRKHAGYMEMEIEWDTSHGSEAVHYNVRIHTRTSNLSETSKNLLTAVVTRTLGAAEEVLIIAGPRDFRDGDGVEAHKVLGTLRDAGTPQTKTLRTSSPSGADLRESRPEAVDSRIAAPPDPELKATPAVPHGVPSLRGAEVWVPLALKKYLQTIYSPRGEFQLKARLLESIIDDLGSGDPTAEVSISAVLERAGSSLDKRELAGLQGEPTPRYPKNPVHKLEEENVTRAAEIRAAREAPLVQMIEGRLATIRSSLELELRGAAGTEVMTQAKALSLVEGMTDKHLRLFVELKARAGILLQPLHFTVPAELFAEQCLSSSGQELLSRASKK